MGNVALLTREATVAADPLAMEHAHIKIRFIIILILGGLWHQTRGKSLLVETEDEPAGYKQLDIKHGGQGGDYVDYDRIKCPFSVGGWDCRYLFHKSKVCTTKDAHATCYQELKNRKDVQCHKNCLIAVAFGASEGDINP